MMAQGIKSIRERIERAGGVFVTGTDTDVGKTIAAACLLHALDGDYWKPVQSGLVGTDTAIIKKLAKRDDTTLFPSVYELTQPLSPHEAARRDGVEIDMKRFQLPKTNRSSKRPLIVEGAGGVMVPLNKRTLVIDLIVKLKLPVVIVARSGLGTINHTLLSLKALREKKCSVLGVIMNGPPNAANVQAIEIYGRTRVLWQMIPIKPLNAQTVARASRRLKQALAESSR